MIDQSKKSGPPSGVSGTRKAVSMIVLFVAIVVLGIELRAGLGQANSAKALAGISEEGIFKELLLKDAQALLSLAPGESVIRETKNEKVLHYRWVSLLRPLMGQPQPELFLVCSPADPPLALAFYTDPEDAKSGFFGDPAEVSTANGAMIPEEMSADPFGIPDAPVAPVGAAVDGAGASPAEPAKNPTPDEKSTEKIQP